MTGLTGEFSDVWQGKDLEKRKEGDGKVGGRKKSWQAVTPAWPGQRVRAGSRMARIPPHPRCFRKGFRDPAKHTHLEGIPIHSELGQCARQIQRTRVSAGAH